MTKNEAASAQQDEREAGCRPYRAESVDGKQHDTGRVVNARGSFVATTADLDGAKMIADALNASAAQQVQADAAVTGRAWSFIEYVAKPLHKNGAILREQAQALLDARTATEGSKNGGNGNGTSD